jgi:hypothetical protein
MLLQKQDNNLVKADQMYKLIQLAFCLLRHSNPKKSQRSSTALKAGLLTKPIVRVHFWNLEK